jgi:MFS family permease
VLILADTGQALSTMVIAVLLYAGQLAVWHIYIITIISAVIGAFQGPAYDASVALLAPKEHLGRAAGMGQTSRAVSQLITPLLAGWLIGVIGLFGIVVIDLATFAVAVVTLIVVHIPQPEATSDAGQVRFSLMRDMLAGWHYLHTRPGLLGLVILGAAANFPRNAALIVTTPLVLSIATTEWVGVVFSAGGAGLLLGGLLMSAWGGPRPRIIGVIAFSIAEGAAFILGGLLPDPFFIALGQFLFWFAFAGLVASVRPILQVKTAPAIQGRVFGIIGAISLLMEAPAYPIAGWLADHLLEPLMMADGALAPMFGPILGVGPGRGIGLLRVLMGLCLALLALVAYGAPRIRLIESELPDMIAGVEHTVASKDAGSHGQALS